MSFWSMFVYNMLKSEQSVNIVFIFQIQVYPSAMLPFVAERSSNLYMYLADTDNGILNGYRLMKKDAMVSLFVHGNCYLAHDRCYG